MAAAGGLAAGRDERQLDGSIHSWQLPRMVRRVLTIAVVVSTLSMIAQSVDLLRQQGLTPQISAIAATAPETSVGQYVLPALQWMFKPLSASSFIDDCLPQLPARVLVVASLVLLIYLLGGDFSEASATRTDQAIARRAISSS